MSTTHVIQCRRISKAFRVASGDVVALRDVSLDVFSGEFVCLVGPSGSGKTTLLDVVGGLIQPSSGHVEIGGVALSGASAGELSVLRRRVIGHVLQELGLIPHLTAEENVELPLWFLAGNVDEQRTMSRHALNTVRLMDRREHYPHQLSAGERQRVAIARAIVLNPTVLLADEPTANLDSANATIVCDLLREICERGSAVVCATHDRRVFERADRVVCLSDGAIEVQPHVHG